MNSKTQEKHYTREELEGKVRKYEGLRNTLTGIAAGVYIFGIMSIFSFQIQEPKILEIYNNAQSTIQILEEQKKNLEDKLKVPYENVIVNQVIENMYKEKREKISNLNKAIESVRTDVFEMRSNLEFKQYQEINKNNIIKRFSLALGSFLSSIGTFSGAIYFNSKKKKLQKLQNKK